MSDVSVGVFARCYPERTPVELAMAIAADGFSLVQLNLSALGFPTIPNEAALTQLPFGDIASAFRDNGLEIWGLSGSYNMAHPNAALAADQTMAAAGLIRRARETGAAAVTLCTGSRDPEDMWRRHLDNSTEEAWADMRRNLDVLLDAANVGGVMLAIEPEPGNIISDTDAAVRLVAELGDRASLVGFILDPANLVADRSPSEYEDVLRDAFKRLGSATICVHAKDVIPWRERLAGGSGLDFSLVRELHSSLPHPVPIIVQDAVPEQMRGIHVLVEGPA